MATTGLTKNPLVKKAYLLAEKLHDGQKRKSGEPYFYHCEQVANIIHSEWGIKNSNFLCAALLHDTLEDTALKPDEIKEMFGDDVLDLVLGVTKLKNTPSVNGEKDTLVKVLDKSFLNPGVAVIKLADRLHNMRTLRFMPKIKQVQKAKETIEIYTKLAESLGMWIVKTELEDIAHRYLDKKTYMSVERIIESDPRLDPNFINHISNLIGDILKENNIIGEVFPRKNGIYSLVKKREKLAILGKCNPNDFNGINDIISFRVSVNSLRDCYLLLMLVHQKFADIVDFDRFNEYLGGNKQVNGYSALQTTLNFPQGTIELAISTKTMEEFNNWGVVSLIRRNETDLKNFVLKFVFTPSGNVRFLPKEATGIDFAYTINPRLGADAECVKINGKKKPIATVIPNSSTVEVITGQSKRAPDKKFLFFCLPSTKKIIIEQIRLEERDLFIAKGRIILEKILSTRGFLTLEDIGEKLKPVLFNLGCQGVNDLYFKVGGGYITENVLNTQFDKEMISKNLLKISTIRVKGNDQRGILYYLTDIINKLKKNITNVDMKTESGKYTLKLMVQNLSRSDEVKIRKILEDDLRFDEVLVT